MQIDVTRLLASWSAGDEQALKAIMPIMYRELHGRAEDYLRKEGSAISLQATDLVHEVYLRFANRENPMFTNRIHFVAVAAQMMRCILVDRARKYRYLKRGSGQLLLVLDESIIPAESRSPDLLFLDDALNQLALVDRRKSTVVELRIFGGMTIDETASALGISSATVINDYRFAKAWIYRRYRKKGA